MYKYQVALPSPHIIFQNSSKLGEGNEPTPRLCSALPSCTCGQGCRTLSLCSRGARTRPRLLPSLVPLGERLCLTDSSPALTPGSCWWAQGTHRSPGEPQDTHLPLCSGWAHPWAHSPILSPDLGIRMWDRPRNKPFRTSPTVQTFLNPPPHPSLSPSRDPPPPSPVPPSSPSPGLPSQVWAAPGRPDFRVAVTDSTLGAPLLPRPRELGAGGASRGHGSGTGRRAGPERNQETRHI